jgi:hypothetical protein
MVFFIYVGFILLKGYDILYVFWVTFEFYINEYALSVVDFASLLALLILNYI